MWYARADMSPLNIVCKLGVYSTGQDMEEEKKARRNPWILWSSELQKAEFQVGKLRNQLVFKRWAWNAWQRVSERFGGLRVLWSSRLILLRCIIFSFSSTFWLFLSILCRVWLLGQLQMKGENQFLLWGKKKLGDTR